MIDGFARSNKQAGVGVGEHCSSMMMSLCHHLLAVMMWAGYCLIDDWY